MPGRKNFPACSAFPVITRDIATQGLQKSLAFPLHSTNAVSLPHSGVQRSSEGSPIARKRLNPQGNPAPSRLLQNIGALPLVKALSYLIPLVTLPYLTRVLGPAEWGRVAWMQVILGYFLLLTDWGFSWSGTRKIAAMREEPAALSEAFLAGWAVQWGLCALAVCTLLGMALYAPFFSDFREFAPYGACVILSGVLFPAWLLAGLEKMREIALTQMLIRAAAVPLIFVLVDTPADGRFVIAASGATGIIGGLASVLWIRRHLGLHWRWPRRRRVREEFLESGSIFVARAWIALYTSLTPTILGAMTSAEAVGQFVLASRIQSAAQSLLIPISQALFPRMSYLFATDRNAACALLRRSGSAILAITFATSVALFAFAREITSLISGDSFDQAAEILRWLSPLPFVVGISNIIGVQFMLPNNMTQAFNRIIASAGIISILIIWPLIHFQHALGAAISTLLAECFVTAAMMTFIIPLRKSSRHENA